MNLIKLTSTDFFAGRILLSGKALLDLLWFLIRNPRPKSLRLAGLILQLIPRYTKVSVKRLINLYRLTQKVNKLNLPGDIVECGVWNGGSAAMMAVADRKAFFIHLLSRLPIFNSVFTTSYRAYYIFLTFYEW